jgi:hypothetical protein
MRNIHSERKFDLRWRKANPKISYTDETIQSLKEQGFTSTKKLFIFLL